MDDEAFLKSVLIVVVGVVLGIAFIVVPVVIHNNVASDNQNNTERSESQNLVKEEQLCASLPVADRLKCVAQANANNWVRSCINAEDQSSGNSGAGGVSDAQGEDQINACVKNLAASASTAGGASGG